jgi:uncharacterized protein YuzE
MSDIKIKYDSEGDILDVIFSFGVPEKRTTIELNDNFIISLDTEFKKALGLTLISYSKLLKKQQKLNLSMLPEDKKNKLLKILLIPPISLFLEFKDEVFKIHSTQIEDLIAA